MIYARAVEVCLSVICQGWRTYNLRRCTIFGFFYSAFPLVAPGDTKATCRMVLDSLHKDARCLVCLHLVTARSSFQQAHVLGAGAAGFHINPPPLHWLVITRLRSLLTLPLRNNRRSPAPPALGLSTCQPLYFYVSNNGGAGAGLGNPYPAVIAARGATLNYVL